MKSYFELQHLLFHNSKKQRLQQRITFDRRLSTLIIEDCQMVSKQNYDKRHQYQEGVLLSVDIVYHFSSVYFDFTYMDIGVTVSHRTQ